MIVPVKDEAEALPVLMAALAAQRGVSGSVEVLLLLNNCRDGSRAVAERLARATPELHVAIAEVELRGEAAHVGTARAALMDAACARLLAAGRPDGLILSTDADSRPAPDWIAATRAEIDRGADAVGGRVCVDPAERTALPPAARRWLLVDIGYRRALERLRALYAPDPHDPFPRHHQHFGASLAVTARAYARCGGMPAVRSSEDVALVHALLRSGARLRHSPGVRVWTSARLVGRASAGLADALAAWDRTPGEPHVEPAADADRRLRALGRRRAAAPCAPPDLDLLVTPDLRPGELGEPITVTTRRLRERAEALAGLSLAERLGPPDARPRAIPLPSFAPPVAA